MKIKGKQEKTQISANVVKVAPNYDQLAVNIHGNGYVPCEISSRYLMFPQVSDKLGDKTVMFVDVMTLGSDDQPRKICTLCIAKEDIERALKNAVLKGNNDNE